MINKKSIKFLLILGFLVFALVLLPSHSWAKDSDSDGWEHNGGDCDDKNAAIYPGADELCNGVDDDCDGTVDEGCGACTDADGDLYYAEANCGTLQDCDDSDPGVNPGEPEYCNDQIDNNCDGFTNESCSGCTDNDTDGYFVEAACSDNPVDCDDSQASINPGVLETCDDQTDNNCDGQIDEGCPVTGDSDGDGFLDSLEQQGFALNDNLSVWDETSNSWGGTYIKGSSACSNGEKCLNPYTGDLFVIWRQLPSDQTKINFENPGPDDYCTIFDFANSPISNFTVWILKEDPGFTSTTRQVTTDSVQKAVVLIEDPGMYGSTGFSQPGSIMVENKGKALIYSHQIDFNIDTNCGGSCVVNKVQMSDAEIKCLHFKNTASHEIWHVLSALNTADLHIAEDKYIMYPATVFTETKSGKRTYTIGDEFSASGLTDPSFQ
ncbi:MAG: putative metal-binding motif-containing protein [Planctomycetota bacterium]|jgi:hypothetical protein